MVVNKSGIYQIRNLVNGKIYIGSAISFSSRKRQHYYSLRRNKHENPRLQNSFNKHKEENFKFEILEVIEDKTKLIEREQFYLDTLKPQYNICKIAGSKLGAKHSKKTKKKNSILHSIPIVQFDMESNKLRDFKSLKEAADITNIHRIQICNACQHKYNHAGGFRWQYKDEYDVGIPLPPLKIISYLGRISPNRKPVVQLDLQGNFIAEFPSQIEAGKQSGISNTQINLACAQKRQKTAGGFKWIYKSEYEKFKQVA